MKPNYVARRSAWEAVTFLRVLFSIFIIPLIVMLVDIVIKKHYYIEFYDEYVIEHSGWLSKKEKKSVFMGVIGVSISQTLWQRICRYGDVHVDVSGRWNINTKGISNPMGLQNYLETKMVNSNSVSNVMFN